MTAINCFLFIAFIFGVNACDGCNKTETIIKSNKKKASSKAQEATEPVGTVEGVVKIKPGKGLPTYPLDSMIRQVLHSKPTKMPEVCSSYSDKDRQPVKLTDEGTLAGVMVAGSDFGKRKERDPITHDVVINNCRLSPSLVVAQKGDKLRLRSNTDYPLLPQFGASAFMESMIKGQEKMIDLDRGGVHSILCGFTAPCGRTDVIVVYHSVYDITNKDGKFKIANYPAGQDTVLNVWHPLFKEANTKIKLLPGETQQIEMELEPLDKYTTASSNKEESNKEERPKSKASK